MKGFVIRYKTRLKAVVLTILIASTATAAAQDYRYEAGIGLGISGYLGDVNQSNVLKNPGFSGEAFFRYLINKRFAVKAGISTRLPPQTGKYRAQTTQYTCLGKSSPSLPEGL